MADVEINYNNSTIVSLNDSATEVLETSGKYMTDDVTIQYTKQGSSTVQSDWNETDTTSAAYILNKPNVAKISGIAEGEIGKETTYNTNYINWEDSTGDITNLSVDAANATLAINQYDSIEDDWTQTGSIDLNNVYSTTNKPTVMELDGCLRQYLSAAGTATITLTSAKVYLVVIAKLNNGTANNCGLYIVQCHNTSSVRAVVSSAVATVSISGTTLTVTTSSTNVDIECIRLTP